MRAAQVLVLDGHRGAPGDFAFDAETGLRQDGRHHGLIDRLTDAQAVPQQGAAVHSFGDALVEDARAAANGGLPPPGL